MDHASPSTKHLSSNRKHNNNNSTPFTSLENKTDSLRQTEQQLAFKTSISNNNNENNRPFITKTSPQSLPSSIVVEKKQQSRSSIPSSYTPLTIVHDENVSPIRTGNAKKRDLFIPQTYKATKHRVERTCLRPTTGGKTVAAMKYLHNDKRHHQFNNNTTTATLGSNNNHSNSINNDNNNDLLNRRLSAEQLKLLSRRIDPSAPLQSPHSSPVKPALPNTFSATRASLSPSRRYYQQQSRRSLQLQYNYGNSTNTTASNNGGSSSSNNTSNDNTGNTGDNSTNQSSSSSSSLYQTCMAIWANSPPSIGDLRHENIKYLSELLKIRLNQAKARALASMGSHDATASRALLLSNKRHRIKLSRKCNQAAPLNTRSVSGNGARLRQHHHHQHQQQLRMMMHHRSSVSSIASSSELASATLHNEDDNNPMMDKKDKQISKKRMPGGKKRSMSESKTKKTTAVTSKQSRRSRATPPLILEDGRRVFVCKSCGKKYKNRNGLAYHRDRCKYKERGPEEEDNSSQQRDELVEEDNEEEHEEHGEHEEQEEHEEHESNESIKCVCEKPTEDTGTMIQCDECHMWQHLYCVGVEQTDIANDYTCPYCSEKGESAKGKTDMHNRIALQSGIDEMEEEEDELAEDDEEMTEEPTSYTANDDEIIDQEMEEEEDNEDEEELLREQHPRPVTLNDDYLTDTNDEFLSSADIIQQQNDALLDMKPVDQELTQPAPLDDNNNTSASQLAQEWEDLLFSQTTDNLQQSSDIPEPWTKMSGSSHDENTFSNWGFSDLSLLQPPSLLFSDNTMVDEDSSNFPPSSDILPPEDPSSEVPPASPDSLWFQFANFEDDYQCEETAQ
ncbi:hypothetical protein BDA99DRAFT_536769 [Phascolomyces articulosus]|uniref:PHD-type domain-containing protein n=1 Tax=Phascolomyces articulosus TaxID=60185 RepID=A0AAD5PER6_9FUNG|nr:hypothetical protein BDA99DRAFT_536769 [Phascolomyces articulosus]